MSLHKEENTHARFAQNLRSQPFNRDRKELEKKGTNVLTEIYKFSATLHPYLRRPSFLTDNVQMLPVVNSSFPHPAHIISQRQVQVEHGSIDALDVFIKNSRVSSAPNNECLHRAFPSFITLRSQVVEKSTTIRVYTLELLLTHCIRSSNLFRTAML